MLVHRNRKDRSLTYIQGALILAITNLVTVSLAFYFRIYFTRQIGAEGMGLFQLVFPLYALLITLASGGITTALSKVIAEFQVRGDQASIAKTVRISFALIGLWSVGLCTLVLWQAEFLAGTVLRDGRVVLPLLALVPAIFFLSVSAIFRGYFFGIHAVTIPATIDILEKMVRLAGLILITERLLPMGIAFAVAGAMAATTAGEVVSTILLFLCYRFRRTSFSSAASPVSARTILTRILSLALPLALGGALATILDLISAMMVPARLQMSGLDRTTALSLYGQLSGMVMPLVHYPGIFVFSLTTTLIPAITRSHATGNRAALSKKCQDSLTIAWSFGLLATVFCVSYPQELCRVLFRDPSAGTFLFWTGLGCAFHYLESIQLAIMNGVGLQVKVLWNTILHILINVVCLYFLVPLPGVGIYGYVAGFLASGVLMVLWNMRIMGRLEFFRVNYARVLLGPLLPFVIMYLAVNVLNHWFLSLDLTYNMILSGLLGLVAFVYSLVQAGVFRWDQIKKTLLFR